MTVYNLCMWTTLVLIAMLKENGLAFMIFIVPFMANLASVIKETITNSGLHDI